MMFLFLLRFVGLGSEKDRGEEYSLFCRAASYSGSAVLKCLHWMSCQIVFYDGCWDLFHDA